MRTALALLAVIPILSSCEAAGPGNDGPLEFGIVQGDNQVAIAGDEELSDPVVGKLVRSSDGGITFRLVATAYAQGTVVSGSPVPGAVVCAQSITEDGPVPFVPCTNTLEDGTATFFFSGGTKAGDAKSEIRGTVEGEPAVFDTATVTVLAGPLAAWDADVVDNAVTEGEVINYASFIVSGRDAYENPIDAGAITALPIKWKWVEFENGIIARMPDSPPADASSGWTVTVPEGAAAWGACVDPANVARPNAVLVAWIDGVRGGSSFCVE